MASKGWIGVDLDKTLAFYDRWISADHVGGPIMPMIHKVQYWLSSGRDVRIFTARAYPILATIYPGNDPSTFPVAPGAHKNVQTALTSIKSIQQWCGIHIGQVLPITCIKDNWMEELYDDRAYHVVPNTGVIVVC